MAYYVYNVDRMFQLIQIKVTIFSLLPLTKSDKREVTVKTEKIGRTKYKSREIIEVNRNDKTADNTILTQMFREYKGCTYNKE